MREERYRIRFKDAEFEDLIHLSPVDLLQRRFRRRMIAIALIAVVLVILLVARHVLR